MSKSEYTEEQRGDVIHIVDENLRQGFAQVPRPVLRAKGLSLKAKVVYIALLDYAWKDDRCFPGHQTLADDLDTSRITIIRALDELRRYQLIDWKRQGLNKPNIYYLLRLSECPNLRGENSKRKYQSATSRSDKLLLQEVAISDTKNTQSKRYSKKDSHISTSNSDHEQFHNVDNSQSPSSPQPPATPTGRGAARPSTQSSATSAPQGFTALRQIFAADSLQNAPSGPPGRDSGRENPYPPPPIPAAPEAAQEERSEGHSDAVSNPVRAGRGRPPKAPDYLAAAMEDISFKLHDGAPRSSLTRAVRLYRSSGLDEAVFVQEVLYKARSIARQQGNVTKRMAYFFAVVEDLLGMREPNHGSEKMSGP